ncbi:constitutive photomorphogenesis protein 10-like [Humulus lupulus]|uniref:constitutive photomorphogenesis protein 10-like n=1 Tax=Humulus lupulus TaxID=3486 RepID=UPI002B4120E3|nr:constitutive photomorphogenesis protein 10-like [Humulus lupulus]XP_062079932.1 constitutive photomorphogenesis protein 10-like [Humulus lupulus]
MRNLTDPSMTSPTHSESQDQSFLPRNPVSEETLNPIPFVSLKSLDFSNHKSFRVGMGCALKLPVRKNSIDCNVFEFIIGISFVAKLLEIDAMQRPNSTLEDFILVNFGPQGTPYEGGIYFLDITFPSDYPFKPPKVVFKTRIYHFNVDSSGNLRLEILNDGWIPALTITKVLLEIKKLFTHADPCNKPLVPGIAQLYLADRAKHDQIAAQWTLRFAK